MTVEEFLKQKEEEEIANKAKTNGNTPEIQVDQMIKARRRKRTRLLI